MQSNVGGSERLARLGVGTLVFVVGVVAYAGYLDLAWTGIGQALIAALVAVVVAIVLATGALSWSPTNAAIGRNSAPAAEQGASADPEPVEAKRPA